MKNVIGLQLCCAMVAEGLLNGSWSALGGFQSRKKLARRPLGAVLERLRSLQDGPMGSEARSGGGGGSIFGWPWPLGAPLIKENRLITTTNTNFMRDLNTPWAKGPANFGLLRAPNAGRGLISLVYQRHRQARFQLCQRLHAYLDVRQWMRQVMFHVDRSSDYACIGRAVASQIACRLSGSDYWRDETGHAQTSQMSMGGAQVPLSDSILAQLSDGHVGSLSQM